MSFKPSFKSQNLPRTNTASELRRVEDLDCVVIDHGSLVCKAGAAGELVPRYVLPSCTGRPKHPGFYAGIGMGKKDCYVGEEAQQKRDVLAIDWPMDGGVISNFDDAQKLWEHLYIEMQILPEEQPLIFTEAPLVRDEQREQVAERMLESVGVSGIHFAPQPVLSVYAAGLSTAVVVDLGNSFTVCPVYEGGRYSHVMEACLKRHQLTSRNLTEHLEELLTLRGYYFTTPAEREIVQDIKEECCYISAEPTTETTDEFPYTMPDGQVILIGNERFRVPEMIFNPATIGKEGMGLHGLIYNSIIESGIDMRVELAHNILLAGGTSCLPGLASRIEAELLVLAPSAKWDIQVITPNERKYSAWVGGSILGTTDNFQRLCVSKAMWHEIGRSIVHESQSW